ncbi:MAG: amidohydrolase [Bacillota bacterium]
MYDNQIKWEELEKKIINYRRDFHKYAETGWTEFRTASRAAAYLDKLGYDIKYGREVFEEESRMGLPGEEDLEKHYQRAIKQGAEEEYVHKMKGGFTGVVAELDNGAGPVIAFRFDMDAVDLTESNDKDHLPFKEGFASVNENAMHACGHDGHTSIGLGLAEVLMDNREKFSGRIKLIFQPAEEGVRGAKSMAESGIVDDVNYIFGLHLGLEADSGGELFPGSEGFLATSKFDAFFSGKPAHAGAQPEEGKNALLAAANAAMNLHAISRNSKGVTRINVGKMKAGSGRNVIASDAHLVIESRGASSELNNYIYDNAIRILESSAHMYDLQIEVKAMGGAESGESDEELIEAVKNAALNIKVFEKVHNEKMNLGGSEDFTYFLQRVKQRGGKGCYIALGTDLKGGHHTREFDIGEQDLIKGVKLLSALIIELS